MTFDLFSRLSKRERRAVYISIALVVCVFFDRAVFRPVTRKIESSNGEITIQEKKLEKSLQILAEESSITTEYNKFTQNIKQALSDEETTAALLSSIEKMASSVSVTLVDMKPTAVEKTEFYKKYSVKLEVDAKMNNLVDFIYQLENFPQLLRVSEFRITPEKKDAFLKTFMTVSEILIPSVNAKPESSAPAAAANQKKES